MAHLEWCLGSMHTYLHLHLLHNLSPPTIGVRPQVTVSTYVLREYRFINN